jgi:hypothetical protein
MLPLADETVGWDRDVAHSMAAKGPSHLRQIFAKEGLTAG